MGGGNGELQLGQESGVKHAIQADSFMKNIPPVSF